MSGAVNAVSKVVSAVIKPVSSLLGGLLGVKQPKMADSNSEPSSQTLRSSKAPARYCLGRFSTGGVLAWGQEQAGSQADNEWLHLVYVLSEGAIEGVDEIWLGEQLIGSYGVRATYELVTDPSEVNAFLLANSPGWRESQIGRGLSFLRLSLKYSAEVFPSGIPDVRIVGRGRNDMHDPRTGSTSYSENAALVILWYLRTVLGVPDDEIIMPSFASAANVCAESVASPGGGASVRYTIGAVVGDDEAPAGVLEKMCRACDGRLIRIGGRWTLQVGAYYGPYDFTITEDMLAGAVQGRTEVDNDKAINTIHGTFIDPSQSWTETDYPPVQVAEWLIEDGAELADDLPLGYVNNPYQGQRLASIELRRRRNGGELTLPMNMFGYNCRPGRVVRVVLPSLNIDGEFIVTDWNMGADGACNVSVSAYGPEIFDDAVGQPYNPLGFIQLPAGGMAPPTGLTFTPDDTAEVFQGVLRWIQPYAAVEYFGVIIRDVEGVAIQTYQVPGAAAQCQVAGLPAGAYTMAVFARGALARSAEATISVSIMGPPAPLSVSTQESFDSITIIPFNPGGLNGGTYEYFYSLTQVANPENAIYLGEGGAFTHNGLSYNTVYHYYVRSRNAYGVSQFYYLTAKTVADPGLILEIIEDQITESQLGQHLKDEVGKISGDGPGSVNERIDEVSGEFGSLSGQIDTINSAIGGLNDQVADLDSDLQLSVNGLNQQIAGLATQLADITGAEDWAVGRTYLAGSLVRFDGSLYRAEQNVPTGTPVSNAAYWRKVGDYASIGEAVAALAIQVTDMQVVVDEITGTQSSIIETTNALIASSRGNRADGEKADALRGWETQASITQRARVEASDKEALAERLLLIDAQVGETSSQLSVLEQAFASESAATATRLEQLSVELGTTSSDLQQEILTRISENAALGQDIVAIQTVLEGVATADALQALASEVERLDGSISAVSLAVTQLTSRIEGTESGLEAVGLAMQELQTSVTEIDGRVTANASLTNALSAAIRPERADGDKADALRGYRTQAQYVEAVRVQATDSESSVERDQLLQAQVADTNAALLIEQQVRTAQDEAISLQATAQIAQLGSDLSATIEQKDTASVTRDESLAERAGVMEARMPSGTGQLGTSAAVQQVDQASAGRAAALASRTSNIEARLPAGSGGVASSASVQEASQTVADLKGNLSALHSIKAQTTVDGRTVIAGLAVGVEGEEQESQVLVYAQRFAVVDEITGELTPVFVVEGGQLIANSAIFKQADIINLIVTGVLQSPDYVPGVSGMRMNFVTGEWEVNGSKAGEGRKTETNLVTKIYDGNRLRIKIGDLSA